MKRFEKYWLGLDTTLLRSRAIRYLKVNPVYEPDGTMTGGLTPSPERRTQPTRAVRRGVVMPVQQPDLFGMTIPSSDGEEWQPSDVIELTSSSSEEHSSEGDSMDLD